MTKFDLLHYVSEAVAGSSALLLAYRQIGEKLIYIWIPKNDSPWVHSFYSIVDKCVDTLELVAMNSKSLNARKAEDFVQAAKQALPDETVNKVIQKAKEEALKK